MHADAVAELTAAVAQLVSVLIWPALIVYVLARFGPAIGDFLAHLGSITLRGGGFEATATRRSQAAAALAAASVAWPIEDATPAATAHAAKEAVQTISDLTQAQIARIANARILWVDDQPNNNVNERQALEAFGVRFVLASTTDRALAEAAVGRFDVIVSDMARGDDQRAGYTLLDALKERGIRTPFIIYASSRLPAHVADARARGAVGCTNRATELFDMVIVAIGATPF